MEVFLYLVLMKLRWPTYIYLLRGCQEVFDCNYECGFAELVCPLRERSMHEYSSLFLLCYNFRSDINSSLFPFNFRGS